jgi:hypothetical protein
VLSFQQSDHKVQSLTVVRDKRNERATLRCSGLKLLRELLSLSSSLTSKAWAVTALMSLQETRRDTEKTHFFNGVEGSASDLRVELKRSFFGALDVAIKSLDDANTVDWAMPSDSFHDAEDGSGAGNRSSSIYLDAAEAAAIVEGDGEGDDCSIVSSVASSDGEGDDPGSDSAKAAAAKAERARFTISCLRSITMDYDFTDHRELADTKILSVLSSLLSSKDNQVSPEMMMSGGGEKSCR